MRHFDRYEKRERLRADTVNELMEGVEGNSLIYPGGSLTGMFTPQEHNIVGHPAAKFALFELSEPFQYPNSSRSRFTSSSLEPDIPWADNAAIVYLHPSADEFGWYIDRGDERASTIFVPTAQLTSSTQLQYVALPYWNGMRVWCVWNKQSGRWELMESGAGIGGSGGGGGEGSLYIQWAKVQTGFGNGPMDARNAVPVLSCDKDGDNVAADTAENRFDVDTPIWSPANPIGDGNSSQDTALFTDNVVGYVTDSNGDLTIVTPCNDLPIGTILMVTGSHVLRQGWQLMHGGENDHAIDMTGTSPAGWSNEGGEYNAVGAQFGFLAHGGGGGVDDNNHDDHVISGTVDSDGPHQHASAGGHAHDLPDSFNAAAGTDDFVVNSDTTCFAAGHQHDSAGAHTHGVTGISSDEHSETDNRPPLTVLKFIIRFE